MVDWPIATQGQGAAMGIVERDTRRDQAQAADFDRFRLRRFVEDLPAEELEIRREPIDLADVAAVFEDNPKAVWFRAAGPERHELVGNVTGSRSRIARAFGVAPNELTAEIRRRLRLKAAIVEVSSAEAPAHQVILTGDDADLTTLPVHLQHGEDGAPFISASMDFTSTPTAAGPMWVFAG